MPIETYTVEPDLPIPQLEQEVVRASVLMALITPPRGAYGDEALDWIAVEWLADNHPFAKNQFYPPTQEAETDEAVFSTAQAMYRAKGINGTADFSVLGGFRKAKRGYVGADGVEQVRDTTTLAVHAEMPDSQLLGKLGIVVGPQDNAGKAKAREFFHVNWLLRRATAQLFPDLENPDLFKGVPLIRNPDMVLKVLEQYSQYIKALKSGAQLPEPFSEYIIDDTPNLEAYIKHKENARRFGSLTI